MSGNCLSFLPAKVFWIAEVKGLERVAEDELLSDPIALRDLHQFRPG